MGTIDCPNKLELNDFIGMTPYSDELNPSDFNITSYYRTKCLKCNEDITVEDHPLDLDYVECLECKTRFKIYA